MEDPIINESEVSGVLGPDTVLSKVSHHIIDQVDVHGLGNDDTG